MRIRGIACENTRRVVHRALSSGWAYDGVTRGSHGQLRWPPTGELVHFGFTPGDRNAWKKPARTIEDVSGVVVWQRTKHGAAHRRPSSTPDTARAQRERDWFAAEADARAAAAAAERHRREISDLMKPG